MNLRPSSSYHAEGGGEAGGGPAHVPWRCMTLKKRVMTLGAGSDHDLALAGLLGVVDALERIVQDRGSDHLVGWGGDRFSNRCTSRDEVSVEDRVHISPRGRGAWRVPFRREFRKGSARSESTARPFEEGSSCLILKSSWPEIATYLGLVFRPVSSWVQVVEEESRELRKNPQNKPPREIVRAGGGARVWCTCHHAAQAAPDRQRTTNCLRCNFYSKIPPYLKSIAIPAANLFEDRTDTTLRSKPSRW